MKFFTRLVLLLSFAPFVSLQASSYSFWRRVQLHGAFSIKEDRYKVLVVGMHPGKQDGEMEVNGELTGGLTVQSYLIRWHHGNSILFQRNKDNNDFEENFYDPEGIFGFTGRGITFAMELLASIDLLRLRIAGGGAIRSSLLKEMVGEWTQSRTLGNDENKPLKYIPPRPYYFTWSPLLRIGFKIAESKNYTLLLDGSWAPSIYYCSELGRSYYWIYQRSFDVGGTFEKYLSSDLNWSFRMAYSFCFNNEVVVPFEEHVDHLLHIGHYIGGITAQVGVGIGIPGLNKCPIAGCHTKVNHKHNGNYHEVERPFTTLW